MSLSCPYEQERMLTQLELFDPEPISLRPDRLLTGMPERVYFERWVALNKRDPSVNAGFTALEWILCSAGEIPRPVSRRDHAVAAAVIQWLGTNCGLGFINGCERVIDEVRAHNEAVSAAHFRARFVGSPLSFVRSEKPTRPIELE